jgi:hypothetical protein
LWLIKIWFSASTFVVKVATFAKRQTVSGNLTGTLQNIGDSRKPTKEYALKNKI